MNYVYLAGLPPKVAMGTGLDGKCGRALKNVKGSPMSVVVTCKPPRRPSDLPSACLSAGSCPHAVAG